MYKTLGIVAHVDAGKTTFSEQLLAMTEAITKTGRVDHKNSFLDYHTIEKERGITVFSDETTFSFEDATYFLLDTPGHFDFSPEMERALLTLDFAILLVSATDGVQGHTETIWELLQRHRIPTFLFFNKIDQLQRPFEQVLEEASERLHVPLFSFDDIHPSLLESLAETDESLIERFLEEELSIDEAVQTVISSQCALFYGKGSALHHEGVAPFFHHVHRWTTTDYDPTGQVEGYVYKIRYDAQRLKNTFIKITKGTLRVRDELKIGDQRVKVTALRSYRGHTYETVQQATAGQLIAIIGAPLAQIGDFVNDTPRNVLPFTFVPTLQTRITTEEGSARELVTLFMQLGEEEQSLQTKWDDEAQQLYVHTLGRLQIDALTDTVRERFGIHITCSEPIILYRETIDAPVIGYGHFEPLRHYAEVHLRIEPNERGAGITFEDATHPNDLTSGNRTEIYNALHDVPMRSLRLGAPLTDVHYTLINGKGHSEHSSPGDFRQATWRAVRQGLEKASIRILEPIYRVHFTIEEQEIGKIMHDIQAMHGKMEAPKQRGRQLTVEAFIPVATCLDYPEQFASFTKGRGSIRFAFSHYEYCHDEDAVIAQTDYDANADPSFTSSSIFCAKGAGYSVPWDEAEQMMHLETRIP